MIGAAKEKELALELLPKVTVDELDRLAKRFAGPDGRVIVISAPAAGCGSRLATTLSNSRRGPMPMFLEASRA